MILHGFNVGECCKLFVKCTGCGEKVVLFCQPNVYNVEYVVKIYQLSIKHIPKES